MASFENPNSPVQPQPGTYVWLARKGEEEITIYIGRAGKDGCLFPSGTLFRGAAELQRCQLTSRSPSDRQSSLDTNFIVGTAIKYFENSGYDCVWKHFTNKPNDEKSLVGKHQPILQDRETAKINVRFMMKKKAGYWNSRSTLAGVQEAENAIFGELESLRDKQSKTSGDPKSISTITISDQPLPVP